MKGERAAAIWANEIGMPNQVAAGGGVEGTIDGVDNDDDDEIDEDPAGGFACVTQNEFAGEEVTVGFIPIQFGFTVTAAPL
jgi:hypothetical protein